MVFNQVLWSIHSKVIIKLEKELGSSDILDVAPCDIVPTDTKVFIEEIQEIQREYVLLKEFINNNCVPDKLIGPTDIPCKGLYLEAFCEGVFTVLTNLNETLYKIESSYLSGSGISMLQIRNEFVYVKNILSSLNIAVTKSKEEKYSGCKILDLCESFINSELLDVKDVFITIQQFCLKRFYMQIKLWLNHTLLHDPYKEFFIKESNSNFSAIDSDITLASLNSIRIESVDTTDDYLTVKYEVNADNMPLLIPFSIAVKMLFIGESLIMCQHNEIGSDNKNQHLDECRLRPQDIASEISEIEKSKLFNLRDFSNFIDNLWIKVNRYIRQISDQIGNVNSELILMWEMYLLGRDELFQEFLLNGSHLLNADVTTVTAINLNVALRDAVYYVYLTENCNLTEQFFFKLPKRRALMQGLPVWSVVYLDCKVKWPLRYLFTNEVIILYNKVFNFLLRLKKAQMDLTNACKGINSIHNHSVRMEFIEVKIHLLSIVSNLQNYCLTYVIANEMNILLNDAKTTMFTELQKSLILFLTNISNRLFLSDHLLSTDKNSKASEVVETVTTKVNKCFMKIFNLCGTFSELINGDVNNNVAELAKLKVNLYEILNLMFSLLYRIDQNLYHDYNDSLHIYTHLYNLMMCLDYNKFYHNKFQLDVGNIA